MSNSASKKKQDERNSKIIRELAAQPENRFCFECGQRGPTYVNITEGSFCCSTCSGLLRGLNPPHRVKSISMATFSNEELDKIRALGNLENHKMWLGLYDGSPPKFASRDDLQSFLVKKYEKRAWYVSKEEMAEQERIMNQAKERASQGTVSIASDSSSQLTGDIPSQDPFSDAFSMTTKLPSTSVEVNTQLSFSPPAHLAPPPPFFPSNQSSGTSVNQLPTRTEPQPVDPFRPQRTKRSSTTMSDPFANFDKQFGTMTLQPANKAEPHNNISGSKSVDNVAGCSTSQNDKYSALAQLDQMFHTPPTSSQTGTTSKAWPNSPLSRPVSMNAPLNPTVSQRTNMPSQPHNPFAPVTMQQQYQQVPVSAQQSLWNNPFTNGAQFGQQFPAMRPNGTNTNGIHQPQKPVAWNQQAFTNPFGPIPKSNTFGCFGDFSSKQIPSHSTMQFGPNATQNIASSGQTFTTGTCGAQPFVNTQMNTAQHNWNPFT